MNKKAAILAGGAAAIAGAILLNQSNVVTPPHYTMFCGDLPALGCPWDRYVWEIKASPSVTGPFRTVGFLYTNHFEIPMTNSRMFYVFN